jgi:hypothetical protein
MKCKTSPDAAGSRSIEQPATDRLLHYSGVNHLIDSKCKTGHTARSLAARGLIRGVRLNERVIRYSEASVLALIAGRAS